VNTELANKAYAHLLIAPTDAIDLITEADLFVYSIITTSRYTFIVFIRIIVNTSVSKKFIVSYKQF
jgi:hypothetical protein